MSIFAYETYRYCKNYNISYQVIYAFNISQYCMYFTLCNGFHALGIHMYKTQMHITIYNINKLMLSQFWSKPFSPVYMIIPYDNPALVTCD